MTDLAREDVDRQQKTGDGKDAREGEGTLPEK
jgi:hypothetical protein